MNETEEMNGIGDWLVEKFEQAKDAAGKLYNAGKTVFATTPTGQLITAVTSAAAKKGGATEVKTLTVATSTSPLKWYSDAAHSVAISPSLPKGASVTYIGNVTTDHYVEVEYNGKRGFASGKYLSANGQMLWTGGTDITTATTAPATAPSASVQATAAPVADNTTSTTSNNKFNIMGLSISKKAVFIGVGVLAVGTAAYFMLRKKKGGNAPAQALNGIGRKKKSKKSAAKKGKKAKRHRLFLG